MKHKVNLTFEEKMNKIDFLRKQRDGFIIGDYRNILAQIYKTIKNTTYDDTFSLDKLYQTDFSNISNNKNIILDYCLDLEQLGYIKVDENGEIEVIKELDF